MKQVRLATSHVPNSLATVDYMHETSVGVQSSAHATGFLDALAGHFKRVEAMRASNKIEQARPCTDHLVDPSLKPRSDAEASTLPKIERHQASFVPVPCLTPLYKPFKHLIL